MKEQAEREPEGLDKESTREGGTPQEGDLTGKKKGRLGMTNIRLIYTVQRDEEKMITLCRGR